MRSAFEVTQDCQRPPDVMSRGEESNLCLTALQHCIVKAKLPIMDTVLEANGTFALNLLKKLGEDNSKNVFLSPVSISSALGMVFMGAKGNTAAQMARVLSFSKSGGRGDDVHQGFQSLLVEVNRTDTQYLLRTANRLFGEKTYEFLSVSPTCCSALRK
ncbi:hypothetical protein MC885_009767 [Smutsia gigantea]|nr:hypothetical protein MC885_009767 [Smutsia gigantea]